MVIKKYHLGAIFPFIFTLVSVGIIYYYFLYTWYNYFGIGLITLGLLVWWLGIFFLGTAWAIKARAKKLVTHGIYSKIRNPIYVGLTLSLIGWAVYIPCPIWAIASVIAIIIFIVRARKEEKVLLEKFGKKYLDYKKQSWF